MGLFNKKEKAVERDTYQLVIRNNRTGAVEVDEKILGLLGTILMPEKNKKGEQDFASIAWSIANTDLKEVLCANALTVHALVQKHKDKTEMSTMLKEAREMAAKLGLKV